MWDRPTVRPIDWEFTAEMWIFFFQVAAAAILLIIAINLFFDFLRWRGKGYPIRIPRLLDFQLVRNVLAYRPKGAKFYHSRVDGHWHARPIVGHDAAETYDQHFLGRLVYGCCASPLRGAGVVAGLALAIVLVT